MNHRSRFATVAVCAALAFSATVAIRAQAPQQASSKYKEIKSFKELPVAEFDMAMEYFTVALGWQCQNCHVRDRATGVIDYVAQKKEKDVAREMIEMVRAVNAGDFGAKINCATCHQGHNNPVGLADAAMMTPDQIAAAAAAAARAAGPGPGAAGPGGAGRPGGAPGAQPGGRGPQTPPPPPPPFAPIIEKYITAMGGQAALDKLQSRITTGTVVTRANTSMPFTIEEKGNKFHVVMADPKGTIASGFDGAKGWSQTGATVADLEGFTLEQAVRLNDLRRASDFAKRYTNLQAGRPTRIPSRTPGGAAINVNLVQGDLSDNVQERFFLDVTSGLLLRRQIITRVTLNGAFVETIDYSDYKDVAGVQVPFTIKFNNWNTLDVYTVVDVKTGAQIPDATFAKPTGK